MTNQVKQGEFLWWKQKQIKKKESVKEYKVKLGMGLKIL
jgi:hypothetical protein